MSKTKKPRYSKSGSGKSRQDKKGREIYQSLEKLLNNRLMLLCGFPTNDLIEDLYSYAYSPQEWEAYKILRGNKYFWQHIFKKDFLILLTRAIMPRRFFGSAKECRVFNSLYPPCRKIRKRHSGIGV